MKLIGLKLGLQLINYRLIVTSHFRGGELFPRHPSRGARGGVGQDPEPRGVLSPDRTPHGRPPGGPVPCPSLPVVYQL